MPRNMSFSATIPQMRDRSKTVTRRQGWLNLKVGDELCAVEKGMGLKRGESVRRIGMIRVVSVTREPVERIRFWPGDVTSEGFPGKDAAWFIELYCGLNGCGPQDMCTRIAFEHVEEPQC